MFEPLNVSLDVLDRARVDPGHRDVGAEPVEREDEAGEEQLAPDLGDPECVGDRGDHRLLPSRSGSTSVQVPPAASIFSLAAALKPCAETVRFLRSSSPLARIFTGTRLRRARPRSRSVVGRHLGAVLEEIQVGEVDGLGVRPERLERHRLLHVRAAQLAHPHVQRVLAALVAGLALASRARRRRPSTRARTSCRSPSPAPRPTRLRGLRAPRGGCREWRPIRSAIVTLRRRRHAPRDARTRVIMPAAARGRRRRSTVRPMPRSAERAQRVALARSLRGRASEASRAAAV